MGDPDFDFTVDCDVAASHLSVTDRYFKKKYKLDCNNVEGEDLCVLLHSNKMCIITLAPSHPILALKKCVTEVNYQVAKNTNRLENKVSGKGKRGAQGLSRTSPLCHMTCSDGTQYTVCSGIKGSLVEVNENLVKNPGLLTSKPDSDGYIAILLVHLKDHEKETGSRLKTPELYQEILQEREKKLSAPHKTTGENNGIGDEQKLVDQKLHLKKGTENEVDLNCIEDVEGLMDCDLTHQSSQAAVAEKDCLLNDVVVDKSKIEAIG